MSLTPAQREKFAVLKRALLGEGDALDEVIAGTGGVAFGSDKQFYANNTELTSSATTWETVDETNLELLGGTYYTDFLVFFGGTQINRDYQIRVLLNDTPSGEIVSKELKDVDDQIEYNTFNESPLPAGTLNVKLQLQIQGGAGTFSVKRWRVRAYRVGA